MEGFLPPKLPLRAGEGPLQGIVGERLRGATTTRLPVLVLLHQEDTLPQLPALPVRAALK